MLRRVDCIRPNLCVHLLLDRVEGAGLHPRDQGATQGCIERAQVQHAGTQRGCDRFVEVKGVLAEIP